MSQESSKESFDSAESTMGLSILSMAVLERSEATDRKETATKPEAPQWRAIKTNDIHQKNGKQAISHRHIEKRRRDRINNTLWMLKDIVPAAKHKYASGSGRLEKADLLEMTVQHLKQVHKSLAQLPQKNDAKSTGKSSASLNQVYYNGFTDGIVHILNELKKLNLLTQKQTEQFLAEEKERRPSAVFEFAGQSGNVTEASPGETMGLQGLPSVEELAKGTTSEFGPQILGDSKSSETTPNQSIQIKLKEENCPISEDGISNQNPQNIKIEKQDASTHSIFDNDVFLRHGPIPASNGKFNCPMLVPAYVLHASGTHYVPVLLPPSAVTTSSTKQI